MNEDLLNATMYPDGHERLARNVLDAKPFYHASNISGLTQLNPMSILHGSDKKVCYFTPNRTYALFYLRDININHVTCGVSDDGVPVYHEQFPNQLDVLYQGRTGSMYCCNADGITQGHTTGVWIATAPVPVVREDCIENVYHEILNAEQAGAVRIIRYNMLGAEKKIEIIKMIKTLILKSNLLTAQSEKAQFIKTYFPTSWELAVAEATETNICENP